MLYFWCRLCLNCQDGILFRLWSHINKPLCIRLLRSLFIAFRIVFGVYICINLINIRFLPCHCKLQH